MSDAFQDRENTFEKQFANDEALRFRATARRPALAEAAHVRAGLARWRRHSMTASLSLCNAKRTRGAGKRALRRSWRAPVP